MLLQLLRVLPEERRLLAALRQLSLSGQKLTPKPYGPMGCATELPEGAQGEASF